ncbi:response regulator transcription factor [Candidatus Ruminimicrobium bovinum]|uniref:response regulator transcription factor n=1 Tax=Candidatus Ruminimicrobium bovinum TaxID=3242779 RepID=UPI0039B92BBB
MKTIMIIDDDTSFLATAEIIFKEKGFEVIKAETAKAGFLCLKKVIPDFLILDVMLPDQNGFAVLKYLKKNEQYSKVPVIVITGDSTVQIDEAFKLGADDCFFKPLNFEEIIKKMEEY